MVHPKIVDVMRAVLRERGITLGDREAEEECLAVMVQRLQETSGLRLIPWLTGEECRNAVPGAGYRVPR
jgi:hypothetical protein